MAEFKAVFFDAAGTLFETREPVGYSYARIAREFGVHAEPEQVTVAFRRTSHEAPGLAFGPGRGAEELRRLERRWWYDLVEATFASFEKFNDFEGYFDSLFAFFADPANWLADPEAVPTLEALRRHGLTLGVVSNFDHRLYRILDGLGLRRCFDSVTISSEAGFAKPAPELFEMALKHHGIRADQALHVGDSEHLDVAGATGAGIAAVLIDRKSPEHRVRVGNSVRISSLAGVIDELAALSG
ncbi:MAG TPA: HAD-IA family hydrolase [Candidatus Binataceae bacterium]|nr:HAD-IA family hydrolase [Candidatus Binataceae bacterium]